MKRVKMLREELNITLDELSNQSHIHKSTLSRIENELQEAKQSHIEILSLFFNVSSDFLLEKTDSRVEINQIKLLDLTDSEKLKLIEFAQFLKYQRNIYK